MYALEENSIHYLLLLLLLLLLFNVYSTDTSNTYVPHNACYNLCIPAITCIIAMVFLDCILTSSLNL